MLMAAPVAANPVVVVTDNNVITVDAKKPGADVQPTMYGIFFEDINYAADGGLYAELLINRSFEFPNPFAGWDISGKVSLKNDGPFDRNPHYVRLAPSGHSDKHTMIENHGFFGIGVKGGEEYRFSLWARVPDGGNAKLWIDLVDNATMDEDQKLGNAGVDISGKEWKKYTAILKPKKTFAKAHLRVWGDGKVTTDVEHISLFPVKTYRGHENGMRQDLAQALEDLRPGVFRFPGGCIVEGFTMETVWYFRNTVGPVWERPSHWLLWHYRATNGLGFHEYLQLCEDLGVAPLYVCNCGMTCQGRGPRYFSEEEQADMIGDILNALEYALGPAGSGWGALRAKMGHPAPFRLDYLEIGNENFGPEYERRFDLVKQAVLERWPHLTIITNDRGRTRRLEADIADDHYYNMPEFFAEGITMYDSYDRQDADVFVGEFSVNQTYEGQLRAAVAEAMFMAGFERNQDKVKLASYAPLFQHALYGSWFPNLIIYDNSRSFAIPT